MVLLSIGIMLGCLSCSNVHACSSLDESMLEIVVKGGLETVVAAMKRFPGSSLVQAAGCWLIGIVSAKDGKQQHTRFLEVFVASPFY